MDGDFNVAHWRGQQALLNQRMCCVRVLEDRLDQRFLTYVLPFPLTIINDLTYYTTVKHLSSFDVLRIRFAVAPLHEQTAIAAFLDRETAKIDATIARYERLIALLREKRQALISHTVTKGLDPDAPMKDSGVEWLGDIPAHWELRRLKQLTPDVTVGIVVNPSHYYVDDGVPCLRSLNISSGQVKNDNMVYISPASNELHRKSIIHAGDVVVVRTGQAGAAAMVPPDFDGANCIDLLIIRRSPALESNYLLYFLRSPAAQVQVQQDSVGAIQSHFNTSTLANLLVPYCPVDEQQSIVAYLDTVTTRINRLASRAGRAIALLREHRVSLISAAVTGKIDVREDARVEVAV